MERNNILIIDDCADILLYLQSILEKEYRVFRALNAEEALSILNSEYIHLIITDVMMPGMDGFEFSKQIKTNIDFCHIPIILLTAKNTIQDKIEGLETGADAYIEKPFSPKYLKVQISNLFMNRSIIKQSFASSPIIDTLTIIYTRSDKDFMNKLNEIILKNIENLDLDIDFIANELNMSRATFYRKVKVISDLSPNQLINVIRLKKAAKMLLQQDCRVGEVYEKVGFSTQKYFTTCFHKQFNMTPTEFLKNHNI